MVAEGKNGHFDIIRSHGPSKYKLSGLVQDYNNSSALEMELLQSYTKPSIWRWLLADT